MLNSGENPARFRLTFFRLLSVALIFLAGCGPLVTKGGRPNPQLFSTAGPAAKEQSNLRATAMAPSWPNVDKTIQEIGDDLNWWIDNEFNNNNK